MAERSVIINEVKDTPETSNDVSVHTSPPIRESSIINDEMKATWEKNMTAKVTVDSSCQIYHCLSGESYNLFISSNSSNSLVSQSIPTTSQIIDVNREVRDIENRLIQYLSSFVYKIFPYFNRVSGMWTPRGGTGCDTRSSSKLGPQCAFNEYSGRVRRPGESGRRAFRAAPSYRNILWVAVLALIVLPSTVVFSGEFEGGTTWSFSVHVSVEGLDNVWCDVPVANEHRINEENQLSLCIGPLRADALQSVNDAEMRTHGCNNDTDNRVENVTMEIVGAPIGPTRGLDNVTPCGDTRSSSKLGPRCAFNEYSGRVRRPGESGRGAFRASSSYHNILWVAVLALIVLPSTWGFSEDGPGNTDGSPTTTRIRYDGPGNNGGDVPAAIKHRPKRVADDRPQRGKVARIGAEEPARNRTSDRRRHIEGVNTNASGSPDEARRVDLGDRQNNGMRTMSASRVVTATTGDSGAPRTPGNDEGAATVPPVVKDILLWFLLAVTIVIVVIVVTAVNPVCVDRFCCRQHCPGTRSRSYTRTRYSGYSEAQMESSL